MKQKWIVNLVVEKGIEISQVQDWINEKITDSKAIEIKLYNTELIFDGSLNSFLGDIDVISPAGFSKVELKKLFKSRPWFIHQFSLKNQPSDRGGIYMTKKTVQCAIPQELTGYACSDDLNELEDLDDEEYYLENTRTETFRPAFSFRRLGWR